MPYNQQEEQALSTLVLSKFTPKDAAVRYVAASAASSPAASSSAASPSSYAFSSQGAASDDSVVEITDTTLHEWISNAELIVRGVSFPTAHTLKRYSNKQEETRWACELRKAYRDPSIQTKRSKGNAPGEQGNLFRSATLVLDIGPDSNTPNKTDLFAECGLGCVAPPVSNLSFFSLVDCDTGQGKKKYAIDSYQWVIGLPFYDAYVHADTIYVEVLDYDYMYLGIALISQNQDHPVIRDRMDICETWGRWDAAIWRDLTQEKLQPLKNKIIEYTSKKGYTAWSKSLRSLEHTDAYIREQRDCFIATLRKNETTKQFRDVVVGHHEVLLYETAEQFRDIVAGHNEILLDIEYCDLLFFTDTPTFSNQLNERIALRKRPFINVVYMQQVFHKHYMESMQVYIHRFGQEDGLERFFKRFGQQAFLPIIDLTRGNRRVLLAHELDDNAIIAAWIAMVSHFYEDAISRGEYITLVNPIAMLKKEPFIDNNFNGESADEHYSPELKEALNKALKALQLKFIECTRLTGFLSRLFHIAVKNSDTTIAELLLNKGADIKKLDLQGRTVLYLAVEQGHIPMVELLLDRGAAQDRAVLYLAIKQGYTRIVELLLDKGAVHDGTVLYMAVKHGHMHIVELLLGRDATYTGAVLYLAVKQGHTNIVELLLSRKGIDLNKLDEDSEAALNLAINRALGSNVYADFYRYDNRIIELFLHVLLDTHGNATLHLATKLDHPGLVALLLNREKVDVNLLDTEGNTALHWAVLLGRIRIVALLLNQEDIKINILGAYGNIALHLAVRGNHRSIVETLLRRKETHINTLDAEGNAALHLAIKQGCTRIIEAFLDRKDLNINQLDANGRNTLYLALRYLNYIDQSHIRIIVSLLRRGANTAGCVEALQQLLSWAVRAKQALLVSTLLRLEVIAISKLPVLHWAIQESSGADIDIVALVSQHVNINALADGKTALHLAVSRECIRIVALLLNKEDIDVNVPDIYGRTALHLAVSRGSADIVALLLNKKDINVSLLDADGRTALDYALCDAEKCGDINTVVLLLQHGVDEACCTKAMHRLWPSVREQYSSAQQDLFNYIHQRLTESDSRFRSQAYSKKTKIRAAMKVINAITLKQEILLVDKDEYKALKDSRLAGLVQGLGIKFKTHTHDYEPTSLKQYGYSFTLWPLSRSIGDSDAGACSASSLSSPTLRRT